MCIYSLHKDLPVCQESRTVLAAWATQAAEQTFDRYYTIPSSAISHLLEEKVCFHQILHLNII